MAVSLGGGLAGCAATPSNDFAPRTQLGPTTTSPTPVVRPTGIEEDKFEDAWDSLKDILVATAVTTTLSDLGWLVHDLRSDLDAVDQSLLNEEERALWAGFDRVYWVYADSLTLWSTDREAGKTAYDGIPLFIDDRPVFPRAEIVAAEYGLEVHTFAESKDPQGGGRSVRYVPDNSIAKLWQLASRQAEQHLLPVMG